MEKIRLNDKDILVSTKMKKIIENDKYTSENNWLEILESESYQKGMITEWCLNWFLSETTIDKYYIVRVLVSENFANGKVSQKDLELFSQIKNEDISLESAQAQGLSLTMKSKNYGEGLINHETLKLMLKTSTLQGNGYISYQQPIFLRLLLCSQNYANRLITNDKFQLLLKAETVDQAETLCTILKSENYAMGIISDDKINKIIKTSNDEKNHSYSQLFTYSALLTSENYKNQNITEENLEIVLDNKYLVISEIIFHIIHTKEFSNEEKDNYILAILNLENKDILCNLCKTYIENKTVGSIEEFAINFILYTIRMSQFNLTGSYTRKKQNKG